MKVSGPIKLVGLVLIVLLAAAVYLLLWPVITQKVEHRVAEIGLTSNEIAANGPLPGDVSLYQKELACAEKLPTPGYFPSINGAEIADSQRSGLYPCATFTGNFDGKNRVFAWRSQDDYQAANFVNNRRPGEMYVTGGDNPSLTGAVAPGPYVAKVDATTGKQIWRTYMDNANLSGNFIATANLNILANGKIIFSWDHTIVLLDPDTGLILKSKVLPTGKVPSFSQDTSWIVEYALEGQTSGDAATLMGDWVTIQTNGAGSKTIASTLVAIHSHDAKKMTRVFPFGPLKKGEMSFAPPKSGGDPENNMVYSSDVGIGKVAGLKFDPQTGEMKTAWVIDVTSTAFMPLVGPKDKRVLLLSNMKKNVSEEPLMPALVTGNYKEQLTWRDAATGRLIAESDYFEGLTPGALYTPGFGGRIYFPTGKGFVTMQVMPAPASP